ncbi:MAG TPA: hypothetical protein PLY40_01720 [Bacillota bacterium]|nr:hypothetical protein [Bacillota bacterium]
MKKETGKLIKKRSALTVAAVYMGTVVGAGFASGQEILQFFGYFGLWGMAGLALATFLFGFFGAKIMLLAYRIKATSFKGVVDAVGGRYLGPLINFFITFFLFGILVAMVAGTGAIFQQEFGLPPAFGLAIMAALSALTVIAGLSRVVDTISAVVPFLIAAVLGVGLYILLSAPVDLSWSSPAGATLPHWPLSGLAYVSYNFTLAVPLLAPLGTLTGPQALQKGAYLGALGLGVCALVILLALLAGAPAVTGFEIPMLAVAGRASPLVRLAYTLVLAAEIYTTAISSLYGFISRLAPAGSFWFKPLTVLVAAASFFAGRLGFAKIVATVYPAMGLAGFFFLAALAYSIFIRRW